MKTSKTAIQNQRDYIYARKCFIRKEVLYAEAEGNKLVYVLVQISTGLAIVIVFLARAGSWWPAFTVWEFPASQAPQFHARVMKATLCFVARVHL